MKESSKTSIFLAVALFLAVIAYFLQPRAIDDSPESAVGTVLFDKFKDPLAIKSLEIAKIDPITGDLTRFQVSENSGSWTVPSHENYPADARDQMGQVASALIDLEVLSVAASDSNSDKNSDKASEKPEEATRSSANSIHALYGVVDPTSDDAGVGSGTGIKIVCTGEEDKELAQLIVGKEVEGKPELRYVRLPNQHPVYVVKIATDQMSTRFEDWIEKNLLKIDTFEISKANIEDYKIDIDRGTLSFIASFDLKYDDQAPAGKRWSLNSMKQMRSEEKMSIPLGDSEELADDKLSDMINALDDLKIVDVRRKPKFLADALRDSKPFNLEDQNPSVIAGLAGRGYYIAAAESGDGSVSSVALYSSNGETQITMKNGVRYILRFGAPAGMGLDSEDENKDPNDLTDSSISLNRYLFILVEFDESQIEKPQLQELPEIPTEGEESAIAEIKSMRESMEKANARLLDQYNEKIESGKKQVLELNQRFADWYYIISENVFKKIHIGLDDMIRPKTDDPDNASREIDLSTEDEEFPDIKELNAPTLPGQEGMFAHPDSPEPQQPEEPQPQQEQPTEEPKPETPQPQQEQPAEESKPETPQPQQEQPAEEPKPETPQPQQEQSTEEPKQETPQPQQEQPTEEQPPTE